VSDDPLAIVEERLGQVFRNRSLLKQAMTHPSYSAEQNFPPPDNQRLEFLGDAVLGFATTRFLFERFPELDEGRLTKVRSALTRDQALVEYAKVLSIGPALLLGRGEEQDGGRERPSNLEDAFEALLGALYLDSGMEAVEKVCRSLVGDGLDDLQGLLATENPKGSLQEYTQGTFHLTPTYEILEVNGPEHCPEFAVRVLLDERELARTVGASRREAERAAATQALIALRKEEEASRE
jgi:ribonuclease-3